MNRGSFRCWSARVAMLAVSCSLANAVPAFAAPSAWWDGAPLALKVHEHAFHRVSANAIGCEVRVRLYFEAPASSYTDAADARNHYRFRAQIRMSGGHDFESEIFDNSEAGRRVFAFTFDSQMQACWADETRKLRKVDVHACRGRSCVPQSFG